MAKSGIRTVAEGNYLTAVGPSAQVEDRSGSLTTAQCALLISGRKMPFNLNEMTFTVLSQRPSLATASNVEVPH